MYLFLIYANPEGAKNVMDAAFEVLGIYDYLETFTLYRAARDVRSALRTVRVASMHLPDFSILDSGATHTTIPASDMHQHDRDFPLTEATVTLADGTKPSVHITVSEEVVVSALQNFTSLYINTISL